VLDLVPIFDVDRERAFWAHAADLAQESLLKKRTALLVRLL
jgi:hypothetical protein